MQEEKHFRKRRRSSAFLQRPFKFQKFGGRRRKRSLRTAVALGVETKFYDTSLVGSAITAPADAAGGEHDPSTTVLLNTVVQGDGESNRDGRKITMKNISVNGRVFALTQANQTALDGGCVVYVALVLDTQTNGITMVSEQVFCNQSANAALAAQPYRNLQFSRRYKVLGSHQFEMLIPDSSYDGTNIEQSGVGVNFRFDVKLRDIPVTYTGTTEDVANITDNSLHLIAYTGSTGIVPTLSYNARLRFVG